MTLLCKAFFSIKQWKSWKSDVLNFKDVMLKTSCTHPHTFMFYKLELPSVDTHVIHSLTCIGCRVLCPFLHFYFFFTLLFDVPVKPHCLERDVFATTLKWDHNQLYDSKLSDKDIIKRSAETKCSHLRKQIYTELSSVKKKQLFHNLLNLGVKKINK